MSPPAASSMGGMRKAAILLVLLGDEVSSQIFRNLPEGEVETLAREITELEYIDPQTAMAVMEEYYRLILTQDYLAQGGADYAQKLLTKAFGDEGARVLMKQVSHAAQASASQLDSLQKSDPQQLAKFLENEHPQTIALILAHMDAKQASALLMRLPEALRAEAIKRLAQLRQFSPRSRKKSRWRCTAAWRHWVNKAAAPTPDFREWPTCSTASILPPRKPFLKPSRKTMPNWRSTSGT